MDISINSVPTGRLIFELFYREVPKTSLNFKSLCQGFTTEDGETLSYKGTPFHRIIPGFMVQGGDVVEKNGTGSASIYGEKFPDENFDFKHENTGVLSMANNGPDTNGSQFFVTTSETPFLDFKHVVFGRVVEGMKILGEIEMQGSIEGKPIGDVIVQD